MRIALGVLALAAIAAAALFVSSADAQYRAAEFLYQKGHFEPALFFCEAAVRRNPRHQPARALATELQFILGRGVATPADVNYSGFFISSLGVGSKPAAPTSP